MTTAIITLMQIPRETISVVSKFIENGCMYSYALTIKMTLYIYAADPNLRVLLLEHMTNRRSTDSGFDLPMLGGNISLNNTMHTFELGVKVAAVDCNDTPLPSLLVPRSSISATPFRLSNSIGLIDSGYRGEVKAKVDILDHSPNKPDFVVNHGFRLFQICRNDFLPWNRVQIVNSENELPRPLDNRGSGGFGSTN